MVDTKISMRQIVAIGEAKLPSHKRGPTRKPRVAPVEKRLTPEEIQREWDENIKEDWHNDLSPPMGDAPNRPGTSLPKPEMGADPYLTKDPLHLSKEDIESEKAISTSDWLDIVDVENIPSHEIEMGLRDKHITPLANMGFNFDTKEEALATVGEVFKAAPLVKAQLERFIGSFPDSRWESMSSDPEDVQLGTVPTDPDEKLAAYVDLIGYLNSAGAALSMTTESGIDNVADAINLLSQSTSNPANAALAASMLDDLPDMYDEINQMLGESMTPDQSVTDDLAGTNTEIEQLLRTKKAPTVEPQYDIIKDDVTLSSDSGTPVDELAGRKETSLDEVVVNEYGDGSKGTPGYSDKEVGKTTYKSLGSRAKRKIKTALAEDFEDVISMIQEKFPDLAPLVARHHYGEIITGILIYSSDVKSDKLAQTVKYGDIVTRHTTKIIKKIDPYGVGDTESSHDIKEYDRETGIVLGASVDNGALLVRLADASSGFEVAMWMVTEQSDDFIAKVHWADFIKL